VRNPHRGPTPGAWYNAPIHVPRDLRRPDVVDLEVSDVPKASKGATDLGPTVFCAQTAPGVERIAWREIQSLDPGAQLLGLRTYEDQNGLVLFDYGGDPRALLGLRTTEDVFFLAVWLRDMPLDRAGLGVLSEAVRAAKHFDVGLRIHREVRQSKGRANFRVISRKQGGAPDYRRVDAQRAVEAGVLTRYRHKWKVVPDDAALEVWCTLIGPEAIVALRLSDATMRHRTYKVQHLPASLRPTIAAAMVLLSDPQPEDLFLDPMCGAGTILIERALAGRYDRLLGGDRNPEAVEICQANARGLAPSLEVQVWEATDLPLPNASVSKVVSNLPFGAQIGSHAENRALYPAFLAEMVRVVSPGGRLVLLTGERALMKQVLADRPELQIVGMHAVRVLGMVASIYVIERSAYM
jgi:tRNA (guanine6-N2)-methyltransferase